MKVSRHPFRRRVLLGTGATGLGNVWAMVVGLVSLPLLLRGLGPGAFGTWVLLQTFSAVSGWFSLVQFGVGTATTRRIAGLGAASDRAGISRTIVTGMVLFLVAGVGAAALLALVGPLVLPALFNTPGSLHDNFQLAIRIFALQCVVDLGTEGAESCLEGLQRVDLSRGVDAARRTLVAGATVVVALLGGGLVGVVTASLGGAILGLAVALVALSSRASWLHSLPDWSEARELLRQARALGLLKPLGVIERMMDKVIVGVILGPTAVTAVEIATQVANGAAAVMGASIYAVLPSAAWLHASGGKAALKELVSRGTRYSLLATWPVVIGVVLLGPSLLRIWLGPNPPVQPLVVDLAIGVVAVAVPIAVASELLLGVGKTRLVLWPAAAALLVNLVASLVLVSLIGIPGTFVGTLAGTAVLVPALGRAALREVGMTWGEFVREALLPAALPCLALAAAIGLILAAHLGDLRTVIAAMVFGGLVYSSVAVRTAFKGGELREMVKLLAPQSRR